MKPPTTRCGILLLLLLLTTSGRGAEGAPERPPRSPDRYLLIVDVSSAMRSRAEAVRESVGGLLTSAMLGELQDGDQVGLWTFNNELHTGGFELIQWDGEARAEIVRAVLEFLEGQRHRRATDFSRVLPHLLDVVAESGRITVVLWSDGDEGFQGTPFDAAINAYFAQHAEDLKQQRLPFVTVLRGYKGSLIDYWTGFPPFPIELPPFPPEPSPPTPSVESPPPKPAGPDLSRTLVTTNTGPIVFAEPLIVSGKKQAPPTAAPTQTLAAPVLEPTNPPLDAVGESETRPPAEPSLGATQAAVVSGGEPPDTWARPGDEAEPRSGPWCQPLLWGAAILVLGAIAAGVRRVRRPRARREASLITKAMKPPERSE